MGGCASKPRDLDGLSTEESPAELTAATTPNSATESAAATTTDVATEIESKGEEKKPLVDELKPVVPLASGEAVPKESETSEGEKGDKITEETATTKIEDKVAEETATTKMAVAAPATKAEEQLSS